MTDLGPGRPPPRSGLLGARVPDAVAIGYDDGQRRWVTAGEGEGAGAFDPLPALDGVVLPAAAATDAAGDDFGHLVRRPPSAVLRPGSPADVAAVVRFAASHGLQVAARGQGHTNFGQSQVQGGIQVDMGPLVSMGAIVDYQLEVGAGVTWSAVLRASGSRGLMPPVIPDFLDLSVGGTLSVGGIGYTSWRHGAQVDNVTELEVVTGAGEVVRCSPDRQPDLFDAALAGLGQCGVIVSARIRLVPAPERVRVFDLLYPDLASMTADMRLLLDDCRFDTLVGLVVPGPTGWLHLLETGAFIGPDDGPSGDDLLDGLGFLPGTQQSFDLPFFDFANRVTVQMGDLKAVGLLDFPHPWAGLFVPGSAVDGFVGDVLGELTPADVGRSFPMLLHAFRRPPLTRPLLRVPDEDVFFAFSLLRAATPGAISADDMLAGNRRLYEAGLRVGATN